MWFVVAAESPAQATEVLQRIGAPGLKVHAFPKEREYRVELRSAAPGETLPPPLEVTHGAGCV